MTEDMYTTQKTWSVILERKNTGSLIQLNVTADTKDKAESIALANMPGWIAHSCKVP